MIFESCEQLKIARPNRFWVAAGKVRSFTTPLEFRVPTFLAEVSCLDYESGLTEWSDTSSGQPASWLAKLGN